MALGGRPLVAPGAPNPSEDAVQAYVVTQLREFLPDEMSGFWSATLNGVRLPSPRLIQKTKQLGLQPGPLDLVFLWPDGVTTWIEMKPPVGRDAKGKLVNRGLRPEQEQWAERLGPERFSLCRSWDEVRAVLTPKLTSYGLRWLTDSEAFRRSAARAVAESTNPKRKRTQQRSPRGQQPRDMGGRRAR